jgi:SAM-dependent methyltransferase
MQTWLKNQFGRPAGLPGALAGIIMAHRPSNRERARLTLERLDIGPGHCVLEIGCGPGVAVERAAELASEGLVLGIDHSEVMVRQARRRNEGAIREGRVEIRLASVTAMSNAEEAFDRIFAVNSVGFWPDPVARLRELRSRLVSGGKLALTVQPRGAGADEAAVGRVEAKLRSMLAQAGFASIRTERLDLKPVAAVYAVGA